jgi:hypothetical protein
VSGLQVQAYRSLDSAVHLAEAVDALNLASRRPAPFATFGYMRTFLAYDEFAAPDTAPLLLAATRGADLVGFLALRRRTHRVLGFPSTRIEFLVTHDVERPTLSARPEDEAECAEAFWRHLVERERGWSAVELIEQERESPLVPPDWVSRRGFRVRRFENLPSATIALDHADPESYLRSLGKPQRRALRNGVARLLSAGQAEVVTCRDPRATPRLLDAYVDIEARSWKAGTGAPVSRHPVRVQLFRALSGPAQAMSLEYRFLLLDGLPIAAQINGAFSRVEYALEMVFDEACADLTPGNFMVLLAIADAMRAGRRLYNFMNNFARQKERWHATITDTWAVQVFRRWSASALKARLGDVRRRYAPPRRSQRHVTSNLSRPPRERTECAAERPPRLEERVRWLRLVTALEREGARLERRSGEALAESLPLHLSAERA